MSGIAQSVSNGTGCVSANLGVPRRITALAFLAALAAVQGCAAISSPVANGVPVRRIPPELLGESRANLQTIPLSLLRQQQPPAHIVGAGDVLGIWIEGILGVRGQSPPVSIAEHGGQPPALGFPIPVRANGTISLPLVEPIKVDGLPLEQVEQEIRKAYVVTKKIILPGRESILVTLQRPRQAHILVIRQDSASGGEGGAGGASGRSVGFLLNFGAGTRGVRRGTGFAIDLPVYENDILNALARSGGFPGSDAVNEIVVERGTFQDDRGLQDLMRQMETCPPGGDPMALPAAPARRVHIPLRYRPSELPTIRPEDVVLQTGDIVFIEAREADVFYTGGLLPSGEYVLPRDSDLDVVQAVLRIGGTVNSGGLNTANVNGTVISPGIGSPSPTLLSVIRKTPDGGQVTIRVDLDRALRDRRERILVQPQDLILLQERPEEAFARYITQVFNINLIYKFLHSSNAQGTSNVTVP